jgi:hypothetical protein
LKALPAIAFSRRRLPIILWRAESARSVHRTKEFDKKEFDKSTAGRTIKEKTVL